MLIRILSKSAELPDDVDPQKHTTMPPRLTKTITNKTLKSLTKVPYPIHDEIHNQFKQSLFLDGDSILAFKSRGKRKMQIYRQPLLD
jgi:hypothetical protein